MKISTLSAFTAAAMQAALALPVPIPIRQNTSSSSSNLPLARSLTIPAASTFVADSSINVAGIYAAAQASNSHILANYPLTPERKAFTNIYSDWNFTDVSAFHFIADMDTDCDGPQSNCKVINACVP